MRQPNVDWCPASGKRSYRTRKAALGAANTHMAQRADVPLLRVYRCSCGDWHLTSQAARV